jgi:Zn-dependent M28 family amino/carboxypeptidase
MCPSGSRFEFFPRELWYTADMMPRFTALLLAVVPAAAVFADLSPPGPASQPHDTPMPSVNTIISEISPDHIRRSIETLAGFGTRHTLSETESGTRGIGAARRWLHSQFERYSQAGGGRLQVSFETFQAPPSPRIPKGHELVNVVAVLPGTMPEAAHRRYYVVGHYDSIPSTNLDFTSDAPGANDDASGTAAVMEIARILAARPAEATIVFLCTAGEEQGLIGARYHADQAAARGETIMGVLSNDIIGDPSGPGGDPARAERHRVRLFSEAIPRNPSAQQLSTIRALAAESDSPSRQLARYIAEVAEHEGLPVKPMLIFRHDRFLRGGDHTAFNDAGFPAVRFTEVYEDYRRQHQNVRTETTPRGETIVIGDLPEFVDAVYVADVARLNAAALLHLANAPSAPPRARIITAALGYDTTIRWDKSPEPDVTGYEIVWRETTSPVWQHVKDVGKATEVTLDLSKDNLFFGVRAYDRDGHRSPVSFPAAARE